MTDEQWFVKPDGNLEGKKQLNLKLKDHYSDEEIREALELFGATRTQIIRGTWERTSDETIKTKLPGFFRSALRNGEEVLEAADWTSEEADPNALEECVQMVLREMIQDLSGEA